MAAALHTYQTYLMTGDTGSNLEKLIDITDYPDLFGEPETIQTTSLSDPAHTYIKGLQSSESLTFGANYTPANFAAVHDLDDGETHHFEIWFGASTAGATVTPDGNKGKFAFDGYVSAQIVGGGVDEKRSMNVIITPSTEITPTVS